MKKKIITAAAVVLMATGAALAYNYTLAENAGAEWNKQGDKFCAKMRDGYLVVMYNGKELVTDALLPNGVVIKMDGTVVQKDGTQRSLKEGECVDKDGNAIEKKAKR